MACRGVFPPDPKRLEVAGGEELVEVIDHHRGGGIVGDRLLRRARLRGEVAGTILGGETRLVGGGVESLERNVVGIEVVGLVVDRLGHLRGDGGVERGPQEVSASAGIVHRILREPISGYRQLRATGGPVDREVEEVVDATPVAHPRVELGLGVDRRGRAGEDDVEVRIHHVDHVRLGRDLELGGDEPGGTELARKHIIGEEPVENAGGALG